MILATIQDKIFSINIPYTYGDWRHDTKTLVVKQAIEDFILNNVHGAFVKDIIVTSTNSFICIDKRYSYKDKPFKRCKKDTTLTITPTLLAEMQDWCDRKQAAKDTQNIAHNKAASFRDKMMPVCQWFDETYKVAEQTGWYKLELTMNADKETLTVRTAGNDQACVTIKDGNLSEPFASLTNNVQTVEAAKDFLARYERPFAEATAIAQAVVHYARSINAI